jgi:Ca2+-binding RTX toxin-like protein
MRKLTMIAATLAVLVALFATVAYAKNFVGDNRANTINGTVQRDVIKGLGGSDTILRHAGNDDIYGGPGHNGISAGKGNDFIVGGNGGVSLRGNRGNDRIPPPTAKTQYADVRS